MKGPQPLSGSYLIHTSSSLISSPLFMGTDPSVVKGRDLIRERLEHPPGSFVIMSVFLRYCPIGTLIRFVVTLVLGGWTVFFRRRHVRVLV